MVQPVARDDHSTISVEDVDQSNAGNLLSNDTIAGGSDLFLRFVNGVRVGDKGTDTIQGTYGTFTFSTDGSYVYTLDTSHPAVIALAPGESLEESLNYKLSDGTGDTDFGYFTLEIAGPNQRPVAAQDALAMSVDDDVLSGNILLNDTDADGDGLQVSFIGGEPPLTYIPDDGTTVSHRGEYGTITVGRDGSFVYDIDEADPDVLALAPGEAVVESFTYKIWDGGVTNSADQDNIFIRIGADEI